MDGSQMDRPIFDVTPERLQAYAAMFQITVSNTELEQLAAQLSGGLAGLAALREVNVDGIEPFVAFPVDRVPV